MLLIIFFLLFSFLFLSAEYFARHGVNRFYTRKYLHLGGSVITAIMALYLSKSSVISIGIVFTLLLFFNHRRHWIKSVGLQKHNYGDILFPLSLTLTAFFFWRQDPNIFIASTLLMGIADSSAGIIGTKLGAIKPLNSKSLIGSGIFFLASFTVLTLSTLSLLPLRYHQIGLISAILTLIEHVTTKGFDNLTVPLTTSALLFLLV